MRIYCQGNDISGNIIVSDRCRDALGDTDITGVVTYNLGPGTYILEVTDVRGEERFIHNIAVEAGEARLDIFEIP